MYKDIFNNLIVSMVDAFALKKLQALEANYPVIKKPSDEVV